MDAPVDVIGVALLVAAAIEKAEGEYFVGGSVASSFQGEPRATNDIDIILSLPMGRITTFVSELGPVFEVDIGMLRDALLHGRSCNIFYLPASSQLVADRRCIPGELGASIEADDAAHTRATRGREGHGKTVTVRYI